MLRPTSKRDKNDAADAAAICEAVTRPSMRFVPIKSSEQQSALMLHRTRDLLIRQRTQLINAMRAHLAEFGLVAQKGREGLQQLIRTVAEADDERLPSDACFACQAIIAQLQAVQIQITRDKRIHQAHRVNSASKRLEAIPGFGVIVSTGISTRRPASIGGRERILGVVLVPHCGLPRRLKASASASPRFARISARCPRALTPRSIIRAVAIKEYLQLFRTRPVQGFLAP